MLNAAATSVFPPSVEEQEKTLQGERGGGRERPSLEDFSLHPATERKGKKGREAPEKVGGGEEGKERGNVAIVRPPRVLRYP